MTLAHIAVWYEVDSRHEIADSTNSEKGAAQLRSQLQNDMGWVRLRRKQACLWIPSQSAERSPYHCNGGLFCTGRRNGRSQSTESQFCRGSVKGSCTVASFERWCVPRCSCIPRCNCNNGTATSARGWWPIICRGWSRVAKPRVFCWCCK